MYAKHDIPLARDCQTRRVRSKTGLPEHIARDLAALAFGGGCK